MIPDADLGLWTVESSTATLTVLVADGLRMEIDNLPTPLIPGSLVHAFTKTGEFTFEVAMMS